MPPVVQSPDKTSPADSESTPSPFQSKRQKTKDSRASKAKVTGSYDGSTRLDGLGDGQVDYVWPFLDEKCQQMALQELTSMRHGSSRTLELAEVSKSLF